MMQIVIRVFPNGLCYISYGVAHINKTLCIVENCDITVLCCPQATAKSMLVAVDDVYMRKIVVAINMGDPLLVTGTM